MALRRCGGRSNGPEQGALTCADDFVSINGLLCPASRTSIVTFALATAESEGRRLTDATVNWGRDTCRGASRTSRGLFGSRLSWSVSEEIAEDGPFNTGPTRVVRCPCLTPCTGGKGLVYSTTLSPRRPA